MIAGGKDKDQAGTDHEDDVATRIITIPSSAPDPEDEATRILPHALTPSEGTPGRVIGVASREEVEADERTVLMPPASAASAAPSFDPAVGWLVITQGPGRGRHCTIHHGQNSIGRAEDQRIRLNFGDLRIARNAHAFIIYDEVSRRFYIRDNGKANLVRLNGNPVMTPTELKDRDVITVGETVMLFVPLCGPSFDWLSGNDGPATGSSG